jgi:pimeloyl-ACP methyl ester carboxylesterase
MMDVIVGGHRIEYQAAGEGSVVVLVSGLFQAAQDWWDAGYVEALRQDHRVVTVDPLGFGGSDKPHDPGAYTFDARTDHLLAVLDAEKVERAVMWGYSFGAMQVEAFATREPDRVEALVLGGSLAGLGADDRRSIFEPAIDTLRSGDWDVVFATIAPSFAEEFRPAVRDRNDLLAVAASHEGSWKPFSAEGRPVDVPVLNYVGTLEPWFAVAYAVAEERGIDFEAVEGADHGGAFREVETVLPVVRRFLDSQPTRQ